MGIERVLRAMAAGALAAGALLPAHAQRPFACSLASQGGGASVLHEGATKQPPLGLDNCEGVRVVAGRVIATALTATGRRRSATYDAGSTVTAQALLGADASAPPGTWLSVLDLLRDPAQSRTLGTRGAEQPALPEGECLGREALLRFDFGSRVVTRFEVRAGGPTGRVVASRRTKSTSVEVPTRQLRRAVDHAWTARGEDGGELTGSFRLAAPPTLSRVRAALREIDADAGLDAGGRALFKAEWLRRHGWAYDAVMLLRHEGFLTLAVAGPASAGGDGVDARHVQELRVALTLAREGEHRRDPLMLLMSARLHNAIGVRGPAGHEAGPADRLLDRAARYAQGRADLLALIAEERAAAGRGSKRGPLVDTALVPVGAVHRLAVAFVKGARALFGIEADGEGQLEVEIFDPDGRSVCRTAGRGGPKECDWLPDVTGEYQVKVSNRAPVASEFTFFHN